MVAFASWRLWPNNAAVDKQQAHETGPVSEPPTPTIVKAESPTPQIAIAPKPRELPLDQLPFTIEPSASELASRPPAAAPVEPMSEKAIIGWLDDRFARLWEGQGIADTSSVGKDRWLSLVSLRLAGASLPSATESPEELSGKLVRTATFAEYFADRIVGFWLKGTPEADAKHPAGKQLRSYVAQQIVARKPWNEVLASLINSRPDQPQSVWLASLAGGDNHRLAGRIGSVMLDEALACARCHDASDNGRVVSMDQDDYWSLVAIFKGVDGKVIKPNEAALAMRQLVDNQSQLFEGAKLPSVYFDRPDGRVQAARYRLPGGDDWRAMSDAHTPRESLARWINKSSITDQASVNLAWRLVFGRPLVAQHAALDGEGYAQRREILSMLAEQFQAHNRDFGQLVTWIVSSQPFARNTLDIDRSRWLAASEDEIVHWSNAAANFAVRLPEESTTTPIRSLETALARIDKWSGSVDSRRSTLAQPKPAEVARPKTTVKSSDGEPMLGYLIRSVKPNHAQSVFINRLVKSKLTWQEQVDHIAGLVGEPAGNARLHSQAQKMLDSKNGDRSAALFELLQGALLCD